ncbi:hypothetical protein JCM11641_005728 [Rhodosporidiobolus odoratus]
MHAALDIVHHSRHPRKRHYRTKEERKRAELERREKALRRFASLLAQLLAPLIPLFSLPALTEHWYVHKDASGQVVHSQEDPPLIVAAGAIALILGVFSNGSILLRLLDTHCRLFTLLTISFLSVHIVLNLVAVTIFAVRHAHPDGFALSTAFWLTVASSAVALAVVLLLLVDGMLTKWWSKGSTGLSGKQRSLVIAFDIFVALLVIGSVCYRYLLDDANYLDALYFVIQSVITTGFGDLAPASTGSQIFSLFFVTAGIITFAIVVAFTRATALEAMQEEYKAHERVVLARLREHVTPSRPGVRSRVLSILTCGLVHSRAQQDEDEDPAEEDRREEEGSNGGSGDLEGEEQHYEEAIEELRRERRQEFRSEVVISLSSFVVFWLVGAAAFSALEGWTYWIGVWFSFVAFSSIGYGDYSPQTQGGRAFFCVWALAGAGILTVFFSVLADAYSQRFKETFQHSVFARLLARVRNSPSTEEELHRAESQALPRPPACSGSDVSVATHPPGDSLHPGPGEKSTLKKERDVGLALLDLLADAKQHLDHMIISDGDAKSKQLDRVVRKVMHEENFSVRNREEVENDDDFKQFIYLRSLQYKLAKLERLAHEALGTSQKGESTSSHGSEPDEQEEVIEIEEAAKERGDSTDGDRPGREGRRLETKKRGDV